LNNGIVNSQLSSNKLFSIDSLSYSDKVTLRQLHTHRILCSCAYIKSILFLFFLVILPSPFFFWLFIQSSLHHHHRSFVCSIDQHSWEIELYVEILYYYCACIYYGNNPLCFHEYDVIQHTTRVMKHYWLSFSISVIRKKSYVIREIN
jgi:hypothetical protein